MAKKKLSNILRKAGIYDEKLEPQIRLTERLEILCGKLNDKLNYEELIQIETNAKGSKKVVNPIVAMIISIEKQLQAAYTSLGLNYNAKPDNYKEAKTDDESSTGIDELLDKF